MWTGHVFQKLILVSSRFGKKKGSFRVRFQKRLLWPLLLCSVAISSREFKSQRERLYRKLMCHPWHVEQALQGPKLGTFASHLPFANCLNKFKQLIWSNNLNVLNTDCCNSVAQLYRFPVHLLGAKIIFLIAENISKFLKLPVIVMNNLFLHTMETIMFLIDEFEASNMCLAVFERQLFMYSSSYTCLV